MSKYTGMPMAVSGIPYLVDDSDPQSELGEKIVTSDGREFTYVSVGGTSLVVGDLIQSQAENTADTNLAVAAAAIGDLEIVTTTTVTVLANEYAGGYFVVAITPGLGQLFRIRSHPAATAAALTVQLEDPIQVALTTTSRLDLVHNPYALVIQNPAAATGCPVGVAVNNITNARFGWIQTGGIAAVLDDGGVSVGTQVVASNGTAGAVEDVASTTQAIVGTALQASGTGEMAIIKLSIQ